MKLLSFNSRPQLYDSEPLSRMLEPVPYLFWNFGVWKAVDSSVFWVIVNKVCPTLPFFVVITMAPFEAFSPYKAAAAAPVRTDIDSISSEFKSAIPSDVPDDANSVEPSFPVFSMGIPSITYKTLLDCMMDRAPRMITLEAPPAPDEEALMLTPATFPFNELIKLASLFTDTASPATCCTL